MGPSRRLAPEIGPARFAELHRAIETGKVDALNYKARVDIGAKDDGPHGVLVRGLLLDPETDHSSPFLRIPETVENIIFAARNELQIDLEPRYERATTSCIVEFAAPPDDIDQALAAACWYVKAEIRGDAVGPDAHWNFSGDGTAVPPHDIVFVDILEPAHELRRSDEHVPVLACTATNPWQGAKLPSEPENRLDVGRGRQSRSHAPVGGSRDGGCIGMVLDVAELAREFDVPEETIRMDLEQLEALGLVLTGLDDGLAPRLLSAGRQFWPVAAMCEQDVSRLACRG